MMRALGLQMGRGGCAPRFFAKHTSPFHASIAFAKAEGGGCAPPPTPCFFLSRASLLQSMRVPSRPMMRALRLQMHGGGGGERVAAVAVAVGQGLHPPPPPNPRAFFKRRAKRASKKTSPFQAHDASIAFANVFFAPPFCKAYESLPSPCCEHCVCKRGGLRSSPQPSRFFLPRASLHQSIRVPSKPMQRALLLQMGGLRPQPSPFFFLRP